MNEEQLSNLLKKKEKAEYHTVEEGTTTDTHDSEIEARDSEKKEEEQEEDGGLLGDLIA